MNVISKTYPFEHIIIKDLYDFAEYSLVMQETEFLFTKLGGPDKTNAAQNDDGTRRKSGRGLFLDDIYLDRNVSNILKVNRKPFLNYEVNKEISTFSLYYRLWQQTNYDCTLLQYYDNKDYYGSHIDKSLFTMIYTYFKTPKNFFGGDLRFPEYDYHLPIEDNQLILFPSIIQHEVTRVETIDNTLYMGGRFSLSNLISWKP